MPQYRLVSQLQKLTIPTMYRILLKKLKLYPSINRHQILLATMDEFHKNKHLEGEEKQKEIKKAQMGVRHVMFYIERGNVSDGVYNSALDGIEPINRSKNQQVYF